MPDGFYLHNGQAVLNLPIDDRGLAYGDGVFETLKVVDGQPEFLMAHLLRLQRGCQQLEINLNFPQLLTELDVLMAKYRHPQAILKIVITRGGGRRGYAFDPKAMARRYLMLTPIDKASYQSEQQGVSLSLCRHRLPEQRATAGLKHLNRLDNVIARSELRPAVAHEGLMLDQGGHIVEGTSSNIFMIKAGVLYTPRLDTCGVAGIIRQQLIETLAPDLGYTVKQQLLCIDDLRNCDEAFICNSLMGICPVLKLDCLTISPQPGPITRELQLALQQFALKERLAGGDLGAMACLQTAARGGC